VGGRDRGARAVISNGGRKASVPARDFFLVRRRVEVRLIFLVEFGRRAYLKKR
jgi:hypothetical protein